MPNGRGLGLGLSTCSAVSSKQFQERDVKEAEKWASRQDRIKALVAGQVPLNMVERLKRKARTDGAHYEAILKGNTDTSKALSVARSLIYKTKKDHAEESETTALEKETDRFTKLRGRIACLPPLADTEDPVVQALYTTLQGASPKGVSVQTLAKSAMLRNTVRHYEDEDIKSLPFHKRQEMYICLQQNRDLGDPGRILESKANVSNLLNCRDEGEERIIVESELQEWAASLEVPFEGMGRKLSACFEAAKRTEDESFKLQTMHQEFERTKVDMMQAAQQLVSTEIGLSREIKVLSSCQKFFSIHMNRNSVGCNTVLSISPENGSAKPDNEETDSWEAIGVDSKQTRLLSGHEAGAAAVGDTDLLNELLNKRREDLVRVMQEKDCLTSKHRQVNNFLKADAQLAQYEALHARTQLLNIVSGLGFTELWEADAANMDAPTVTDTEAFLQKLKETVEGANREERHLVRQLREEVKELTVEREEHIYESKLLEMKVKQLEFDKSSEAAENLSEIETLRQVVNDRDASLKKMDYKVKMQTDTLLDSKEIENQQAAEIAALKDDMLTLRAAHSNCVTLQQHQTDLEKMKEDSKKESVSDQLRQNTLVAQMKILKKEVEEAPLRLQAMEENHASELEAMQEQVQNMQAVLMITTSMWVRKLDEENKLLTAVREVLRDSNVQELRCDLWGLVDSRLCTLKSNIQSSEQDLAGVTKEVRTLLGTTCKQIEKELQKGLGVHEDDDSTVIKQTVATLEADIIGLKAEKNELLQAQTERQNQLQELRNDKEWGKRLVMEIQAAVTKAVQTGEALPNITNIHNYPGCWRAEIQSTNNVLSEIREHVLRTQDEVAEAAAFTEKILSVAENMNPNNEGHHPIVAVLPVISSYGSALRSSCMTLVRASLDRFRSMLTPEDKNIVDTALKQERDLTAKTMRLTFKRIVNRCSETVLLKRFRYTLERCSSGEANGVRQAYSQTLNKRLVQVSCDVAEASKVHAQRLQNFNELHNLFTKYDLRQKTLDTAVLDAKTKQAVQDARRRSSAQKTMDRRRSSTQPQNKPELALVIESEPVQLVRPRSSKPTLEIPKEPKREHADSALPDSENNEEPKEKEAKSKALDGIVPLSRTRGASCYMNAPSPANRARGNTQMKRFDDHAATVNNRKEKEIGELKSKLKEAASETKQALELNTKQERKIEKLERTIKELEDDFRRDRERGRPHFAHTHYDSEPQLRKKSRRRKSITGEALEEDWHDVAEVQESLMPASEDVGVQVMLTTETLGCDAQASQSSLQATVSVQQSPGVSSLASPASFTPLNLSSATPPPLLNFSFANATEGPHTEQVVMGMGTSLLHSATRCFAEQETQCQPVTTDMGTVPGVTVLPFPSLLPAPLEVVTTETQTSTSAVHTYMQTDTPSVVSRAGSAFLYPMADFGVMTDVVEPGELLALDSDQSVQVSERSSEGGACFDCQESLASSVFCTETGVRHRKEKARPELHIKKMDSCVLEAHKEASFAVKPLGGWQAESKGSEDGDKYPKPLHRFKNPERQVGIHEGEVLPNWPDAARKSSNVPTQVPARKGSQSKHKLHPAEMQRLQHEVERLKEELEDAMLLIEAAESSNLQLKERLYRQNKNTELVPYDGSVVGAVSVPHLSIAVQTEEVEKRRSGSASSVSSVQQEQRRATIDLQALQMHDPTRFLFQLKQQSRYLFDKMKTYLDSVVSDVPPVPKSLTPAPLSRPSSCARTPTFLNLPSPEDGVSYTERGGVKLSENLMRALQPYEKEFQASRPVECAKMAAQWKQQCIAQAKREKDERRSVCSRPPSAHPFSRPGSAMRVLEPLVPSVVQLPLPGADEPADIFKYVIDYLLQQAAKLAENQMTLQVTNGFNGVSLDSLQHVTSMPYEKVEALSDLHVKNLTPRLSPRPEKAPLVPLPLKRIKEVPVVRKTSPPCSLEEMIMDNAGFRPSNLELSVARGVRHHTTEKDDAQLGPLERRKQEQRVLTHTASASCKKTTIPRRSPMPRLPPR